MSLLSGILPGDYEMEAYANGRVIRSKGIAAGDSTPFEPGTPEARRWLDAFTCGWHAEDAAQQRKAEIRKLISEGVKVIATDRRGRKRYLTAA